MTSATIPTHSVAEAPTRPRRSNMTRTWAYFVATLRAQVSDVMFLFFTIALPVLMYLVFAGIYGDIPIVDGVNVGGVMMVTMAAYGGLGAAMNSGFQIQLEQRSGWFRQLSLTGITPTQLVVVRALVASLVSIPAIAVLFVVAWAFKGVRLPWEAFTTSGLMLWVTLIPMVLIGLAIAMWVPGSAGQALVTIVLMTLSILGGLWFPIDMFPGWLQQISRLTPSFWIGELAIWRVLGGDLPVRGVITLLVWGLALALATALGYRHAVRTSRR